MDVRWGDEPTTDNSQQALPPTPPPQAADAGEVLLLDEPTAAPEPTATPSQRASILALQQQRQDPGALQHDTPPWERYQPQLDARGHVLIDARAEWLAGLRPASFAERLRQIGVADTALQTAFEMLQDDETPAKVRADLAKDFLNRAYGTPGTMGNPSSVQVLIVNDLG